MTWRHKALALVALGAALWLIGVAGGSIESKLHPWDGLLYGGSLLMIFGLRYHGVFKLKEQLSDAEDRFQALSALSGKVLANGKPILVTLAAGDSCAIMAPDRQLLVNLHAFTACRLHVSH